MNHSIKIILNISIVLFCTYLVHSEDYDENVADDYDASKSLDSESNEIFNASLNERPVRERNAELNKSVVNDSHSENKFRTATEKSKCQPTFSHYPYSVSVQKKNAHFASGALIHKKWILTCASEFYNIRETIKLFRARLGSVNYKKGGALVPLKGIELHPAYIFKQPSFDLAMLRIGHHVPCSESIRPISLSTIKESVISANFLMTYWPRLIVNGKLLAKSAQERLEHNSMRVSYPKMIPWNRCYNIIGTYNSTLDESSICLKPMSHSPCMPDVGAPVIADDGLWGITSGWVSDDCLTSPNPTIFTRISLEPISSWLNTLLEESG